MFLKTITRLSFLTTQSDSISPSGRRPLLAGGLLNISGLQCLCSPPSGLSLLSFIFLSSSCPRDYALISIASHLHPSGLKGHQRRQRSPRLYSIAFWRTLETPRCSVQSLLPSEPEASPGRQPWIFYSGTSKKPPTLR